MTDSEETELKGEYVQGLYVPPKIDWGNALGWVKEILRKWEGES